MSYFVDLINQIISYGGTEVNFIIDDNDMIWFSGSNMKKLLGYDKKSDVIRSRIKSDYKTTFGHLKQFLSSIPPNSQDHAIYISEPGLYNLVTGSELDNAKEMSAWIYEKVLPSIRKSGSYKLANEERHEIDILNAKLKTIKAQHQRKIELIQREKEELEQQNAKLARENEILKHNQKKTSKYPKGGIIYIIRPMELHERNIYKIGYDANTRWHPNPNILIFAKIKILGLHV
jgi:prophage antirepressor-like protein